MQVGDQVQVVGTVMDMVGGSVLVLTPGATGREYWFLENHVQLQSQPTAAEATAAEAAEPAGT